MHHGSCGCMSVRGNDAGRIGIRPTRLLGRDGDLTQCPRSPTTVSRRSSTNVAALRNDELLERLVAGGSITGQGGPGFAESVLSM